MKKSLLIASTLFLIALPALSNPGSSAPKRMFKSLSFAKTAVRLPRSPRLPARAAEIGSWEAQNESMYMWTGEWTLAEENALTFNNAAKILTQFTTEFEEGDITGYTRTLYTYDINNMTTERLIEASLDGVNFIPSNRRVVAYDPIITELIISNEQTLWYDGQEYPGNSYKFNITRNDNGDITLAERAVLFNGEFDPTERFSIEYGNDGKAVSTILRMLDFDGIGYFWKDVEQFSNITWEEFDGQIYNQDSMISASNKIKSADMYDFEEDMLAHMSITYSKDGGYTIIMIPDDEPDYVAEMIYIPLPNGGYSSYITEKYKEEVVFTIEEVVEYAANGLLLREFYYEEEMGDDPYIEESKGEFIGGSDNQPEAYEYSIYDQDEDEWYPYMRVEFSNYIFIEKDQAAVEGISSDGANPDYYNLHGIRIQDPAKGSIYIERRGNQTHKVLKK